ncbi:hypothetical protein F383_09218 [Gossypium arboreum]|uniref:Uncharacterized protein n=1 Tax=Gossypium arboreum TaxID=29729 RepID=A0A0B0N5R6_GOSAR|nr:hypothetical protein F383_35388 [Gossypium arboreum]KHG08028.1 hypothetical protein F383_35388 [Gossypium arboreum]KHG14593.1 hypothetical protein F383_20256 [Gossypium arboreum]KHG21545.1 hypothetical protein F383_09218 [Gossypium arboreum]KHG21546.1 hypothetical protein F383_09218 [Gossypium arboreum]
MVPHPQLEFVDYVLLPSHLSSSTACVTDLGKPFLR